MKTRIVSGSWSHCRAILRRWLRFAWMGRLPLLGPRPWQRTARPRRRRAGEPPTIFRPSLEVLERRWTPDDLLGAASAPLTVGGMVLLAGNHLTPLRLLLDTAPPVSDAPAPQPETSLSPYRYTDPDNPLLTDGGLNDLAFVAAVGQDLPEDGINPVHNTPGLDEPAVKMPVNNGAADGSSERSPATAQAMKSPVTTSPPASSQPTDSPAKYAGSGGGGGGGGRSTPNAGMGGGGPTGAGSANLHLPGLTSLQRFTPDNFTALAADNAAGASAATNPVHIASNALAPTATSPGSQATPQSSPISNGAATAPTPPALPSGNKSNSTNSSSTATAAAQPSTLNLLSSAVSAVSGQLVTFTATVSSPGKPQAPTGKVVFSDGGQTLGSAVLHSGTASFATANLPVGSYKVRAAYQGDNRFQPSANTQSQTVHPDGTAVALQSRQTSAATAQAITFTASVYPLSPGSGTPTGTVDFHSGSAELGKAKLNGGVATLTTSGLLVSSGGVTAVYEGDSQFRGSQGSFIPNLPPPSAGSGNGLTPADPPSSTSNGPVVANTQVSGSGSGSGSGSTGTGASAGSSSTSGFT